MSIALLGSIAGIHLSILSADLIIKYNTMVSNVVIIISVTTVLLLRHINCNFCIGRLDVIHLYYICMCEYVL